MSKHVHVNWRVFLELKPSEGKDLITHLLRRFLLDTRTRSVSEIEESLNLGSEINYEGKHYIEFLPVAPSIYYLVTSQQPSSLSSGRSIIFCSIESGNKEAVHRIEVFENDKSSVIRDSEKMRAFGELIKAI